MKNKKIYKGFTLVELLATIIIIGIIALITTAVVLGVIEKADKEAFKSSVLGIFDSIDYWLYENDLDEIPKGQCILLSELELKNISQFDEESCIKSVDGQPSIIVCNKKYCAGGTKDNLTIIESDKDKLDSTAPNVDLVVGTVTTSKATVTATCSDDESGIKKYEFYNGSKLVKTYTTDNVSQVHVYTKLGKESTNTLKVVCTNGVGITKDASESITTKSLSPTYTVDKTGYQSKKIVTISYPKISGEALTNYYRIESGDWIKVTGDSKDVEFTSNGSITAKTVDEGGNEFAASTYTVSQVDSSQVSCSIEIAGTKGKNNWYTSNVALTLKTSPAGASGLTFGIGTDTTPFYTTGTVDKEGVTGTATRNLTNNTSGTTYYGYVKNGVGVTNKCSVTYKKDSETPKIPTITASDSKLSGQYHSSAYTLTLGGSSSTSGVSYYYGTTTSPTTSGTKISSGEGISTVGTKSYYAKACNGAGLCSNNASYIASLETCDPTINLTFTNPSGGSATGSSSACYITPVVAEATTSCSGGTFKWYVDDEKWDSTENDSKTESTLDDWIEETGKHTVSVKLENAGVTGTQYFTKTNQVDVDLSGPTVNATINTITTGSATVVINATDVGCSGIDESSYKVYYKLSSDSSWTTVTSSTNTKKITNLTPGKSYNFKVSACDKDGRCTTSDVVTKSTETINIPELTLSSTGACGNNGSVVIEKSEIGKYDSNLIYKIKFTSSNGSDSSYVAVEDGYVESDTGSVSSIYPNQFYNIDFASMYNESYGDVTLLTYFNTGDAVTLAVKDSTNNSGWIYKTYTFSGGTDTGFIKQDAPTKVETTSTSIKFKINQTSSNQISKYTIRYKKSTDSTFTVISINNPTSSEYTLTDLEPNTTYVIRVNVTDSCNHLSVAEGTIQTENYVWGCSVSNLTYKGYKVTCNVDSAVAKSLFRVWSDENGQDDLKDEEGTISNGKTTYTVNTSDHNYDVENYKTHVNSYDSSGNLLASIDVTPDEFINVPNGPYKEYELYNEYITSDGGRALVLEATNNANPYVKIGTVGSRPVNASDYMTRALLNNITGLNEDLYEACGSFEVEQCLINNNVEIEYSKSFCDNRLAPLMNLGACEVSGDYYELGDTKSNQRLQFTYDCEFSICTFTFGYAQYDASVKPIVIKTVNK